MFGFHALRREAVTLLRELAPGQAMKMAGHTSSEMQERYTLADRREQKKAVVAFQKRLRLCQNVPAAKPPRKKPVSTMGKTLNGKEMVVGPAELESATSTVSR